VALVRYAAEQDRPVLDAILAVADAEAIVAASPRHYFETPDLSPGLRPC
jgi:hypothetical protein